MKFYFLRLFDYNHWANTEVLASLATCPVVPPRAVELLGHILITEQFADEIVHGRDALHLQNAPDPTLHECALLVERMAANWTGYFMHADEAQFAGEIEYVNSKGVRVRRQLADVLSHAVNHSTYHRGQIATLVRAAGGVPAVTDLTVWAAAQRTV